MIKYLGAFSVAFSILFAGNLSNRGEWEVVYEFPQWLTLLDVTCSSPYDVWVVGANEQTDTYQIYYSSDAGESWTMQYSAMDLSVFLLDIDMANNSKGYISGTYIVYYPESAGCGASTMNGGTNWNPIPSPDGFISSFRSVNTISEQEAHLVGGWGWDDIKGLYSTYDGGTNWVTHTVPASHGLQYADFYGSQKIWVTGGAWPEEERTGNDYVSHPPYFTDFENMDNNRNSNGRGYEASIWYSNNGGNSWAQQHSTIGIGYMSGIDMVDDNFGIAVGSGDFTSQIYKTTDGGNNWEQIHFASENTHNLVEIEMVNENIGWAVGYNSNGPDGQPGTSIVGTTDGGESWLLEPINEPAGLLGLSMVDEHRGFACGGNNMKISRIIRFDDGYYNGNNNPELITIPFNQGWTWFSLNLENDDMSLNTVLESIGSNGTMIKNQDNFAQYYDDYGWYGFETIDVTDMFMISVSSSCEFNYEGYPVDCSTATIELLLGWNWVAFLPQNSTDINVALDSIQSNGNLIKNQSGFAQYYDDYGWYGMESMNPGEGYMLMMNANDELIYP